MTLAELERILPRPAVAYAVPTAEEWVAAEKRFGSAFPSDYRELLAAYGVGSIDGFFGIASPTAKNKYLNLFYRQEAHLHAVKYLREHDCPTAMDHVDPADVVFQWAVSDNGDEFFCRIGRNQQSVIVENGRYGEWEEFDGTIITFLVKLLDKEIAPKMLPTDFPDPVHSFKAYDDEGRNVNIVLPDRDPWGVFKSRRP